MSPETPVLEVESLAVSAGDRRILGPVSLPVRRGEILAFIGPAGSGKSTLLKVLNRMTDFEAGLTIEDVAVQPGTPLSLRGHARIDGHRCQRHVQEGQRKKDQRLE